MINWLPLFRLLVLSYVSMTMKTNFGLVLFVMLCLVRHNHDQEICDRKRRNIFTFLMLLLDWKTKCGNFGIWIFISCFQEHYVIEMFWEVIKTFSVENQKKFLKWVFSLHISWLLLVSSWLKEKLNFKNITIVSCFFIRFVTGYSRGPLHILIILNYLFWFPLRG